MPLKQGARVLDVATGTGAVLLAAARQVGSGGQVTGIDLSGGILQEAEHAAAAEGLTNVTFRKMDAEHLDFPDQTFDAVTCALSLFLCPDMEAALREMYRVSKPGGSIGISMFGNTPPPFNPGWPLLIQQFEAYGGWVRMPRPLGYASEEVEALLSRSGFRSIELRSEPNDIAYASLDDWWAFQLTIGPRPSILRMDEDTRAVQGGIPCQAASPGPPGWPASIRCNSLCGGAAVEMDAAPEPCVKPARGAHQISGGWIEYDCYTRGICILVAGIATI
jgi:ubiquinone/menaquinone biosynthesis C-methylase UbiE